MHFSNRTAASMGPATGGEDRVADAHGDDSVQRPWALMTPVEVPSAAEILAAQLRERILVGDIPAGDSLPPERQLVEQTQLSRATVREALRILEVQGLLKIRPGRTGGAFVRRPDGQAVADSVELLIRGGSIRLSALHETREVIEPYCAALAAKWRTDEDLGELLEANREIADAGESMPLFLRANVRWHVAVARASHNELLAGFIQAISQAIYLATDIDDFVDDEVRKTAIRAHGTITDAIRDQQPSTAERRMRRHVHGFATAVQMTDQREQIEVSPDH